MEKRVFINAENMREEMRKIREEKWGRGSHMHHRMENEVKLFTDKNEMVTFVNQLKDIENVDIFKIEDNLYKVFITRKCKHEGCCKEEKE